MTERDATEHSFAGLVSFFLASTTGLLVVGLLLGSWALSSYDPPGDEVAYGFGFLALGAGAMLCQIVALALGVVGVLQRRYRRSLALAGLACSVVVLALTSYGTWDVIVRLVYG